ncbi:RicAFT regulatory complex protein RicA family protein [Staphylococcus aureus]|nr:RicAFT regulatory complex protein RicA family protein [Staphylococcus aureus]
MYNKDDVLKQADNIANKIKNLDTIKTYQQIEAQIHQNQTIKTKMDMLKKASKTSSKLSKLREQNALEQSEHTIQSIEAEINTLPIVEQFQTSQYEANQLLKMFVSTMETRLNDHNKAKHSD